MPSVFSKFAGIPKHIKRQLLNANETLDLTGFDERLPGLGEDISKFFAGRRLGAAYAADKAPLAAQVKSPLMADMLLAPEYAPMIESLRNTPPLQLQPAPLDARLLTHKKRKLYAPFTAEELGEEPAGAKGFPYWQTGLAAAGLGVGAGIAHNLMDSAEHAEPLPAPPKEPDAPIHNYWAPKAASAPSKFAGGTMSVFHKFAGIPQQAKRRYKELYKAISKQTPNMSPEESVKATNDIIAELGNYGASFPQILSHVGGRGMSSVLGAHHKMNELFKQMPEGVDPVAYIQKKLPAATPELIESYVSGAANGPEGLSYDMDIFRQGARALSAADKTPSVKPPSLEERLWDFKRKKPPAPRPVEPVTWAEPHDVYLPPPATSPTSPMPSLLPWVDKVNRVMNSPYTLPALVAASGAGALYSMRKKSPETSEEMPLEIPADVPMKTAANRSVFSKFSGIEGSLYPAPALTHTPPPSMPTMYAPTTPAMAMADTMPAGLGSDLPTIPGPPRMPREQMGRADTLLAEKLPLDLPTRSMGPLSDLPGIPSTLPSMAPLSLPPADTSNWRNLYEHAKKVPYARPAAGVLAGAGALGAGYALFGGDKAASDRSVFSKFATLTWAPKTAAIPGNARRGLNKLMQQAGGDLNALDNAAGDIARQYGVSVDEARRYAMGRNVGRDMGAAKALGDDPALFNAGNELSAARALGRRPVPSVPAAPTAQERLQALQAQRAQQVQQAPAPVPARAQEPAHISQARPYQVPVQAGATSAGNPVVNPELQARLQAHKAQRAAASQGQAAQAPQAAPQPARRPTMVPPPSTPPPPASNAAPSMWGSLRDQVQQHIPPQLPEMDLGQYALPVGAAALGLGAGYGLMRSDQPKAASDRSVFGKFAGIPAQAQAVIDRRMQRGLPASYPTEGANNYTDVLFSQYGLKQPDIDRYVAGRYGHGQQMGSARNYAVTAGRPEVYENAYQKHVAPHLNAPAAPSIAPPTMPERLENYKYQKGRGVPLAEAAATAQQHPIHPRQDRGALGRVEDWVRSGYRTAKPHVQQAAAEATTGLRNNLLNRRVLLPFAGAAGAGLGLAAINNTRD